MLGLHCMHFDISQPYISQHSRSPASCKAISCACKAAAKLLMQPLHLPPAGTRDEEEIPDSDPGEADEELARTSPGMYWTRAASQPAQEHSSPETTPVPSQPVMSLSPLATVRLQCSQGVFSRSQIEFTYVSIGSSTEQPIDAPAGLSNVINSVPASTRAADVNFVLTIATAVDDSSRVLARLAVTGHAEQVVASLQSPGPHHELVSTLPLVPRPSSSLPRLLDSITDGRVAFEPADDFEALSSTVAAVPSSALRLAPHSATAQPQPTRDSPTPSLSTVRAGWKPSLEAISSSPSNHLPSSPTRPAASLLVKGQILGEASMVPDLSEGNRLIGRGVFPPSSLADVRAEAAPATSPLTSPVLSPPPSPAPSSSPSAMVQPMAAPLSPTMQFPEGRALRKRTEAQKHPYLMDFASYALSLSKNGWRDAVVKLQRPAEESAASLTKRKEASNLRGRDSLGGWLEYEAEQRISRDREGDFVMRGADEDYEENGDALLAREEARKLNRGDLSMISREDKGKGKQRAVDLLTGDDGSTGNRGCFHFIQVEKMSF